MGEVSIFSPTVSSSSVSSVNVAWNLNDGKARGDLWDFASRQSDIAYR